MDQVKTDKQETAFSTVNMSNVFFQENSRTVLQISWLQTNQVVQLQK
jgi:hypothetical protein